MALTKAQIITEIQNNILTGGNRTTAASMRQICYDILDFVEIAYTTYFFIAVDSGSGNYVGTNANVVALNKGDEVRLLMTTANTGPATFNPNSTIAYQLLKFTNKPLQLNDVHNNKIVVATFDGTSLQITSITDNIGEGN